MTIPTRKPKISKIEFDFEKFNRGKTSPAPIQCEALEPEITGMFDVIDAIEAVIQSADDEVRERLAQTLDAYAKDFPDEFYWAVGAQAPALLGHLLMSIDASCRPALCDKCAAAERVLS